MNNPFSMVEHKRTAGCRYRVYKFISTGFFCVSLTKIRNTLNQYRNNTFYTTYLYNQSLVTPKNSAMKASKLQNTMAACTGRAMLYCYRVYISFLKAPDAHKPVEAIPGKGHIRFTSKQFQAPCYN